MDMVRYERLSSSKQGFLQFTNLTNLFIENLYNWGQNQQNEQNEKGSQATKTKSKSEKTTKAASTNQYEKKLTGIHQEIEALVESTLTIPERYWNLTYGPGTIYKYGIEIPTECTSKTNC